MTESTGVRVSDSMSMEGNALRGKNALRSNWILFPILLIVADLVIVLSALSVIALAGMIPNAQSEAVRPLDPPPNIQPQSALPPAMLALRLDPHDHREA